MPLPKMPTPQQSTTPSFPMGGGLPTGGLPVSTPQPTPQPQEKEDFGFPDLGGDDGGFSFAHTGYGEKKSEPANLNAFADVMSDDADFGGSIDFNDDSAFAGEWGTTEAQSGSSATLLENALIDETVTEIHVKGPRKMFVRVKGQYIKVKDFDCGTVDDYHNLLNSVLISKSPKNVKPIHNDFLVEMKIIYTYPDGQVSQARCHILTPPIIDTAQVTIAKQPKKMITLDDMVDGGTMSSEMAQFIRDICALSMTTIISGASGAGKALTHDTVIHTVRGGVTMGEIQVGDLVINGGEVAPVLGKFPQGKKPVYELKMKRGDAYKCDLEHNWVVRHKKHLHKPEVKTTKELMELGAQNYYITSIKTPTPGTMQFPDGVTNNTILELAERINELAPQENSELSTWLPYVDVYARKMFYAKALTTLRGETPSVLNMVAGSLGVMIGEDEAGGAHQIESIVPTGEAEEMSCITVGTKDSTFLIGEHFLTTHNTTLLSAVGSDGFTDKENLIICEDLPELNFGKEMETYLETTPEKPGRNDERVTMEYLVRQTKRMRPTRVIIGEVRGPEIVAFLDVATSGVDGCMNTMHADSPQDCITKIVNMATQNGAGGDAAADRVKHDISKGVNFIIQAMREEGKQHNRHLITEIAEVGPVQGGRVSTTTIFRFDEFANGGQGAFVHENMPSDRVKALLMWKKLPSAKNFGLI